MRDVKVMVIGGGIAGLTAAHELAERGAAVRLVERQRAPDREGRVDVALGGMARTQWVEGDRDGGDPSPTRPRREGSDGVALPGEHGFRFFPGYYRHLFDTMRRTPILDAEGRETGLTAFDRLVSVRTQAFAKADAPMTLIPRDPPADPALGIARAEAQREAFGYTPEDAHQLAIRVLRYLCTCPDRRAVDCERMSWWDWLQGTDPMTGQARYRYSEAFTRDFLFAPRVLAAFDAQWGDARTNGSTWVQLMVRDTAPGDPVDSTLNGPTSEAWLDPWRRWLGVLGVEIRRGEVERLELGDDGLRAVVDGEVDGWADYYVLAVDAVAAERLTATLPRVGVPGALEGFTTRLAPGPDGAPGRPRHPTREVGLEPWDRFQTLTGLQLYFREPLTLAPGHVYLLDAPWALSCIAPQQFWRRRPVPGRDGWASLVSIDLGEWRRGGPQAPVAADCDRRGLVAETWRQLRRSLGETEGRRTLPTPAWAHVDEHLVFGPDPAEPSREIVVENRCPYLVPVVGDWQRRPPGEPSHPRRRGRRAPPAPGVWQSPRGGALVHWDRLVFAGTWTRTFTRMTTMESANESARHAVNALLDHEAGRRFGEAALAWPPPARSATAPTEPLRQATPSGPLGDLCAIWDMEDHEVAALRAAREADQSLFDQGLPHPWDLMGVEATLTAGAAGQGAAGIAGVTPASLLEQLRALRERLERGLGAS